MFNLGYFTVRKAIALFITILFAMIIAISVIIMTTIIPLSQSKSWLPSSATLISHHFKQSLPLGAGFPGGP